MTVTDTRPFGRLTWPILIFSVIMGLRYLAADLASIDGAGGRINDYLRLGRDFVNVWEGGKLAIAGQSSLIYDLDGYRRALWDALQVKGIYAYSYPPHSLLLAAPFALLPYGAALLAWQIAGLAAFVMAARPYLREARLPWWFAAILPAGIINIWAAHYGFFIGAATLAGWRLLEQSPRSAGAAFAAATLKPHLGVLIVPVLLIRRQWTAIVSAVIGVAALAGLSMLLFGPQLWLTYVTATLPFHARLIDEGSGEFLLMMPTTTVALRLIDLPRAFADIAQLATAGYAVTLVIQAARRGARLPDIGLLAGSAIFLVLPYAFIYDMTVHCLSVLVLAARIDARAVYSRMLMALAFVVPLIQMPLAFAGLPVATLILAAALWQQYRVVVQPNAQ